MSRFVRPELIEGSGRVVRVFDTSHVAHRACRTVSPGEAPFEDVRDRLRRLAKVNHPNLARVVAVGEEDGVLKVVSEWLPGGQLSAAHLPNPGRLLVGPADALYALHREGIAHGHVEPRSLVLDGAGVVKLVDGGIRDGSVHEDLVAFGTTLSGLYAGRPMVPELQAVADRAKAGHFGDARELSEALREACRDLPPVFVPSMDASVHDVPVTLPVDGPRAVFVPFDESLEEEDEGPGRWWLILLVALMLTVVLLVGAAGVGWWMGAGPETARVAPPSPPVEAPAEPTPVHAPEPPAPEPPPAHPPEPVHEPVADAPAEVRPDPQVPEQVVMVGPLPPISVVRIEPVEHGPTAAQVRVAPTPAPPKPEPVPAPVATISPAGGWRVVSTAGRAHPTVVLSLDARNMVEDRLGRRGRPRLEIRCSEHRLTTSLVPGVQAVEALPNEAGLYSMQAGVLARRDGGAGERAKLRMVDQDPHLYFPGPEKWVSQLAAGRSWSMSYAPFASPEVTAEFDTAGLEALLPELGRHCRL